MPARKRVQGQQRRLRKYLRTQAAAYGNDPAALEAREKQLEASLAKLDADLAKLGAEAVDDAVDDADDDADDRPNVPDAESDAEYEADDEAERPSDAELAEAKATQRRRLTQMREDMASLLAVNRRIRAALEGEA
jgi:hypothetical protein